MKKIIAITAAALFSIAGATTVSAQTDDEVTVEDCAEADNGQPAGCFDENGNPIEPIDGVYPALAPEEGTVPVPETTVPTPTQPPAGLPATGSSGTSGILQVGALLLAGGLLIFVAARRRNTATA